MINEELFYLLIALGNLESHMQDFLCIPQKYKRTITSAL